MLSPVGFPICISMNTEINELFNEAQTAIVNRRYEQAYNCLMAIIKSQPDFAEAYFLLSRIASEFRNYKKEMELLHKAVSIVPNNVVYVAHLSKAYAISGDLKKAHEYLQVACGFETNDALALDAIGVAYNRLNMYKEASHYFQQAVTYNQNNFGMYFNLGSTLKFCGDFAGARDAFEKAIALYPNYYKAHAALTSLGGITKESNHIDTLKALLPTITNSDDFLHICHALSKELEALGNYDESFAFLEAGKQKRLESLKFDIENDKVTFAALKKYFSNATHTAPQNANGQGALFVVGMPRSGTTLVERIISSHSKVATAGELQNFSHIAKVLTESNSNSIIDAELVAKSDAINYRKLGELYIESTEHLKKGCDFLVDKLPLNVLYAGHIIRALPCAKIICLDRNPLDTIFSNYRQLFSFSDATYGYSLSLKTTTQYYVEFKNLIDFWQAAFPDNFYIVNYENLVKDSVAEIKKIVGFCDLDWEENCLKIEKNEKPVATASSVQVRSPISDKSVGQWKHYQAYAAEAEKLLQESGLSNI
jgi:tetratricopeptide (TPR) repeat protein